MREWIGVDLDGTLAEYHGFQGHENIGPPIPKMVERVLGWIEQGILVKIFTARIDGDAADIVRAKYFIHKWLDENGFPKLEITNVKDYYMTELYDDRAVQVEFNTGELVGYSTRSYREIVKKQDDK